MPIFTEEIGLRVENRTRTRIRKINKHLYYNQSISTYLRKVITDSIKNDESILILKGIIPELPDDKQRG